MLKVPSPETKPDGRPMLTSPVAGEGVEPRSPKKKAGEQKTGKKNLWVLLGVPLLMGVVHVVF